MKEVNSSIGSMITEFSPRFRFYHNSWVLLVNPQNTIDFIVQKIYSHSIADTIIWNSVCSSTLYLQRLNVAVSFCRATLFPLYLFPVRYRGPDKTRWAVGALNLIPSYNANKNLKIHPIPAFVYWIWLLIRCFIVIYQQTATLLYVWWVVQKVVSPGEGLNRGVSGSSGGAKHVSY